MTAETNENSAPEEMAKPKKPVSFNVIQKDMGLLTHHDEQQQETLFDTWKAAEQLRLQRAQGIDLEDDGKPTVDLYDDRNQAPEASKPVQKPEEDIKTQPSRRGTKFGVDLIQERWATFEQQQAKALDGINDMEKKREDAQGRLDDFNGKHGSYLEQGYKKATGGDLKRMETFRKLLDQQLSLQKGIDTLDKALDQGRDRYQRDHHEFHGEAWNRIKEQGKLMGSDELVNKAEEKSQKHQQAQKGFSAKLPADEAPKHTKSLTEQNIEEYSRLSEDIAQKAETDPTLQSEITQGREQVKKIGEDTALRRAERQEGRNVDRNHKHKQSV